MLFRLLCAFIVVLPANVYGGIMVETIDGRAVEVTSFLMPRAPGDGLPVALRNNGDLSYLTTVLMGTPPQRIQMAPSLSQNQISVASAPEGVNDQSFYNPAASSSFVQSTGQTASIPTTSGASVNGNYAGEICTIQSTLSAASFMYHASVVLTDPAVTNDLYPNGARAVLGYGVDAPQSAPANATLIGSFLPANFTLAQCGIELNHLDDPIPDGILTMGALDTTAFKGDFTSMTVPATPQDRPSWSIPFDSITYLSGGANQTAQGSVASVDLYHSVIQLSTASATSIYNGIAGSRQLADNKWSIPCNSTFPVTLTFAGKPFTIYERDTIQKQPDGSCNGAVVGGAGAVGKIGAPFLRNVYTQFAAAKAANGTVSFSVSFAEKVLRLSAGSSTVKPAPSRTTVGPSATSPTGSAGSSNSSASHVHAAGFLSTFILSSILAAIFL